MWKIFLTSFIIVAQIFAQVENKKSETIYNFSFLGGISKGNFGITKSTFYIESWRKIINHRNANLSLVYLTPRGK
jgi:hypothetical protein